MCVWYLGCQLGQTALHYAALNGHVEMCAVLLRAGVMRDALTKVNRTPLHLACQHGHLSVVQLLIANGADLHAADMVICDCNIVSDFSFPGSMVKKFIILWCNLIFRIRLTDWSLCSVLVVALPSVNTIGSTYMHVRYKLTPLICMMCV